MLQEPEGKIILLNKPLRWTSFDAVNKVKGLLSMHMKRLNDPTVKKLKVGHAGTLDPLATGLLIICTGKFTKRIEEFQAQHKEYTGTMVVGATTPSFDLETAIDQEYPTDHITLVEIETARLKFLGDIEQTPPNFSAIKVKGKRAYKLARKGITPELKSATKTIYSFEITRVELPQIDFKVSCSKGTYIRALARDFGIALGSGAHLTKLCRTKIGTFDLSQALTVPEFETSLNL